MHLWRHDVYTCGCCQMNQEKYDAILPSLVWAHQLDSTVSYFYVYMVYTQFLNMPFGFEDVL